MKITRAIHELAARIVFIVSDVFYQLKTRIALSLLLSIILSISFPIIYVIFLLLYTLAKVNAQEPLISQLSLYALSPGMYILEMKSEYKGFYNVFTFIPSLNLLINMIVFFILILNILNLAAYIYSKENIKGRLGRLIKIRRDSPVIRALKKVLK